MVLGYEALTANQASYNTTENQRYQVTALWDNRETDRSNIIFLGPSVDVEENTLTNTDYTVYPNPVSDQLTINAKGLRHVSLVTLTGAKVYDSSVIGEMSVIEMENLTQGLYLLTILTEDGIHTVKVMKR